MTALSGEHFTFLTDHTALLSAARSMNFGVRQKVCAQCGVRDDQLRQCSMCKMVWYCDKDHQEKHWQQHRLVCGSKNTGGKGGAVPKNRNGKKKKKTKETNFNLDQGVLDEVAGNQAAALTLNDMQFQGIGGQGRGRRKSPMPDLSTPIDSHSLEASSQMYRAKTPPLYHVQDSGDSQSLEEGGFSQEWFNKVLQDVIKDLNLYGVCAVDDFLGEYCVACVCVCLVSL